MRLALSIILLCSAANAFVGVPRLENHVHVSRRTQQQPSGILRQSSETSHEILDDDIMGDLPERKYEPKEGDNVAGGGSKFKAMMEMAQRRKEEGGGIPLRAQQAQAQPQQVQPQQYQPQPQQYQAQPQQYQAQPQQYQQQPQAYGAAVGAPVPVHAPPLPPGWASTIDPASGMTYYYNTQTGAVQWEMPRVIPPPPPMPPQPPQVPPQPQMQQAVQPQMMEQPAVVEQAAAQVQPAPEPIAEPVPVSAPVSAPAPTAQLQPPDEEFKPVPPRPRAATNADPAQVAELRQAVEKVDSTKVASLLEGGLEMDEEITDAAFWAVVNAVDAAEKEDKPLPADVPRMLHHIFDADMNHLLSREQLRMNVTCMQPKEEGLTSAHQMNYIFDDSSHKDLPLMEGRRCEDGSCCDACSRNIYPTFASDAETSFDTFPELVSLTFNELETMPAKTILMFARLIERVRRTISYEYGVPLKTILPLQAYSRKYVAGSTQQGGGGGEGDFVTLHTDEATHAGYHYSCVLYLSTQGKEFEGGAFVFNDPDPNYKKKSISVDDDDEDDDYDEPETYLSLEDEIRRAGRKFTPFHPTRGAAVIFSSGWENMHEVERITEGTRYCVPAFFTTSPVPEQAYEQMVQGKPKTDEDIADDWLHLLLAHRQESPLEAAGRVKELLMKWHVMCAPLSEH